jgi:NAD(P)-dependent dehydrogenase (short-subunit alcohol dehydrogenase family)
VSSAFASVKAKYGHIDVLVNNAGVYDTNGISLSSTIASRTATWWREFEVNVRGTMLVTKLFLALIGTTYPATLIYLSSGAGLVIVPGSSAYGISKLADLQLAAFASAENSNMTAIAFHPRYLLHGYGGKCGVLPPVCEGYAEARGQCGQLVGECAGGLP